MEQELNQEEGNNSLRTGAFVIGAAVILLPTFVFISTVLLIVL